MIVALPHLGGWEWAGRWIAEQGLPITVVVEPLEPPELFEWFVSFRQSLGMTVVPVGAAGGGRRSEGVAGQRGRLPALRTATSRAAASRSSSSASARRCREARRHWRCGPAPRSCRPRCTSPRARDGHHAVIRPPIAVANGVAHCARTWPASPSPWPTSWRSSSGRRPSSGTCSSPTGPPTRDMGTERCLRCSGASSTSSYLPCGSAVRLPHSCISSRGFTPTHGSSCWWRQLCSYYRSSQSSSTGR